MIGFNELGCFIRFQTQKQEECERSGTVFAEHGVILLEINLGKSFGIRGNNIKGINKAKK